MRLRQNRKPGLPLLAVAAATLLLLLPAAAAANDAPNPPMDERLADTDITQAIEMNIAGDASVPFDAVDVRTRDGIVTLSGEVDNLLARDRALAIAENVKGVRSVVQQMDVKPVERPDDALVRDVQAALLTDPAADSYEIEVTAHDGIVALSGQTDSWHERSFAVSIASGVRGVRAVKNEMTVDFDYSRSDGEILADVKKRLDWDVRLNDALIDAQIQDGRVTLSGWVGSAAERTLARSVAWVAGTREVDASELAVRWWAENDTRASDVMVRPDEEIEDAVRDAFLYDPRVLSFEPDVTVKNGEVTLSGVVDNAEAKRAAEMDARNTTGVWRVRNLIKVRPLPTPPDTGLVETVRDAIARDPYLSRHPITVTARGGRIVLDGRVDYEYEKRRADDVASALNGVAGVANELRVDRDWTWRTDREIRRNIEDELFWSPFVDEDDVSVMVENGVATLEGRVDDWTEAVAAIENAREGGARRVQSRLEIESLGSL